MLDEVRAPIIAAIYAMRAEEKLGVPAIHAGLTADPATYPPADPAPNLVSLLPEVTADLATMPPSLQAELFDAFDIQIIWNAPRRQRLCSVAWPRRRRLLGHMRTGAPRGERTSHGRGHRAARRRRMPPPYKHSHSYSSHDIR